MVTGGDSTYECGYPIPGVSDQGSFQQAPSDQDQFKQRSMCPLPEIAEMHKVESQIRSKQGMESWSLHS